MLELQRQLVFDDDQTLTEVDIMLKCYQGSRHGCIKGFGHGHVSSPFIC